MKICALGDSVLKGVVPENGRYRVLDGRFSDLCAAELGISVENYGRFGSTVSGGERMLDRIISRGGLGDYGYTLLEFGGNDCDYDWKAIAAAPDDAHFPNTPLPEFREIYAGLIDKVRAEGSKPVMLSLVPIVSERYFETFSAGMNESGKRAGKIISCAGSRGILSSYMTGTRGTTSRCSPSRGSTGCRSLTSLRLSLPTGGGRR